MPYRTDVTSSFYKKPPVRELPRGDSVIAEALPANTKLRSKQPTVKKLLSLFPSFAVSPPFLTVLIDITLTPYRQHRPNRAHSPSVPTPQPFSFVRYCNPSTPQHPQSLEHRPKENGTLSLTLELQTPSSLLASHWCPPTHHILWLIHRRRRGVEHAQSPVIQLHQQTTLWTHIDNPAFKTSAIAHHHQSPAQIVTTAQPLIVQPL